MSGRARLLSSRHEWPPFSAALQQQQKCTTLQCLCQYVTDFLLRRVIEGAGVKANAIVIKKYGNRRLYDTSTSQYINLEEIASRIRNGKEVQVVDARTGQDLTRLTLTQIIVEDAKGGPGGLPLELLRQLIVASDHVGREFVMWYLKSAFNAYQRVQESVQSGLKGFILGDRADNKTIRQRKPARVKAPQGSGLKPRRST